MVKDDINKILVVEDEEVVRAVCVRTLRKHGFEAIVAPDGAAGLEIYKQRRDEICLVLSDVKMPVRSGVEMFRDILKIDPEANVILMSGYSMSELVPDDLRKLCSLVSKPFTADQLIEAVKKCLKYEQQHHPEKVSA